MSTERYKIERTHSRPQNQAASASKHDRMEQQKIIIKKNMAAKRTLNIPLCTNGKHAPFTDLHISMQ